MRLLVERGEFDSPWLADHLVTVGKVLGVLNIEKHIQELDRHNAVDVIKEVYLRVLPDTVDQTAFFKHKGWDYDRSSPSPSRREG